MWTTLALSAVLSLSPVQGGALSLTNVRSTYGMLGAPRPDARFLPGDALYLAFDIVNLTVDKNGNTAYTMPMEVTDAKGKVWYGTRPEKIVAVNYLGGNRLPALAHVEIGLDMPAGQYTLKVTVTDLATKKDKSLTYKFEVLPLALGIVRLSTSYDPNGNLPAPMLGVVGEALTINYVIVGFLRDKTQNPQPHLTIELNFLDEAGKPTLAKPISEKIPNPLSLPAVEPRRRGVDIHFSLPLTRPGKFTIEIKVMDHLAKKTVTARFPLAVLATEKTR